MQSCSFLRAATVAVALLLLPSVAPAQWVSFQDEVATRLVLSSVPSNDAEEKDLAVGDLNGDGLDDVIVVRKVPFSNPGARSDVLLMNENGILVDRTADFAPEFLTTLTDARDVVIEDFTGDGWPDVVIANTFREQPQFYRNRRFEGTGTWQGLVRETDLRFPLIQPLGSPGPLFCGVAAGDIDNDADADIYFSNYDPDFVGTIDIMLKNDGQGFFTDVTTPQLGTYANVGFGPGVEIVDMNGDGWRDIIKISTLFSVSPWNDIGVFVLYNSGLGIFDQLPFQKINSTDDYMFVTGNLNTDTLPDMYLVTDFDDRVALHTGTQPNGQASFSISTTAGVSRTDRFGGNLQLIDIDRDGDQDVAISPIDVDIQNCSGPEAREFCLLRNDGNGVMDDPYLADQNWHVRPHDFAFVDLDQDRCFDIVMGLCDGYAVFVQQNCAPVAAELPLATSRISLRAGPNPSSGFVNLALAADVLPGERVVVELFDARGSRVRTLWTGSAADAPTDLRWNGRDDSGRAVVSGVYFARVTAGAMSAQEKVLLLR